MKADDYDFLINNTPADFKFKPACGKVDQNGTVTVSGHNMTPQEIDNAGKSYSELIDVFNEIDLTATVDKELKKQILKK